MLDFLIDSHFYMPHNSRMQLGRFSRRSIFGLATLPWLTRRPAAAAAVRRPTAAAEIWNRTELYFGGSKPDGSMVTEAEFSTFINEVTQRFPDGLTLLKGYGQFKNSADIIIQEESRVLILFYPAQMLNANSNIESLRELYKTRFQQESVLRVDGFSLVSF